MLILGYILASLAGLAGFIVFIFFFIACFQRRGMLALLLLVPIVNIPVFIYFLASHWSELCGYFFLSCLFSVIQIVGTVMIIGGAQDQLEKLVEIEAAAQAEVKAKEQARAERDRQALANRNAQRNAAAQADAPPPPDPIFMPGQLAEGQRSSSGPHSAWPEFTAPDIGLEDAQTLSIQGYDLVVPTGYIVDRIAPAPRGGGTEWRIVSGQAEPGNRVELLVRVYDIEQQADGKVYQATWSEVLGQAGVSSSAYQVTYGQINDIAFARCIDEYVRTGHGTGTVRYIGQLAPINPQRIEIEFKTSAKELGKSYAFMAEAIARTVARGERVVLDPPSDTDAIASVLEDLPEALEQDAVSTKVEVRGPFAFMLDAQSQASFSGWSKQGLAWQTSVGFSGASGAQMRVRLEPVATVPGDRIPPIVAQGPRMTDTHVYALGAKVGFARLWNDEIFARIEHRPQPRSATETVRSVSYHGYLNQYKAQITLTNRDDSGMTMAELESVLRRCRLATPPELVASAQSDWLQEMLASDRPPFELANGVKANEAVLLDERGRVIVSPQYDAQSKKMFAVYPVIDDANALSAYEQWASSSTDDELLGREETLDELKIQPIAQLRPSHRPKQLIWQVRTDAGVVGMTLHVEDLKPTDLDLLIPLKRSSTGRTQVCLGRRIIQPTQAPEIAYREQGNLRIWRVKLAPSARQKIARCHYLALVPGKMIVISTSYLTAKPEQLDAFDASVATLVYRDSQALGPVSGTNE